MSGFRFATLLVVVPSSLGLVKCVIFYFFETIYNGNNLVFWAIILYSADVPIVYEILEFFL